MIYKNIFLASVLFINFVHADSSLQDLVHELSKSATKEEASIIKEKIRQHSNANKPLSDITEKQANEEEHDAVYVKYDIFKHLRDGQHHDSQVYEDRRNLARKFSDIYGSDQFYKKHVDYFNDIWSKEKGVTAFDLAHFWSSRIEINGNRRLSKGKYNASRYFADAVHQGLFNGRSHQINKEVPFNADPANKLSVLQLLDIADQAQAKEDQDWIALKDKLKNIEKNLRQNECKVLVGDLRKTLQIDFKGWGNERSLDDTENTSINWALEDTKRLRQNVIALALPCLEEPYAVKQARFQLLCDRREKLKKAFQSLDEKYFIDFIKKQIPVEQQNDFLREHSGIIDELKRKLSNEISWSIYRCENVEQALEQLIDQDTNTNIGEAFKKELIEIVTSVFKE